MKPQVSRAARLLTQALARYKHQNKTQSLRAVALRLKVSPSYLSRLVNGKKPLSPRLVQPLGQALQMDGPELERLQRAVLENLESTKLTRLTGIQTLRNFKKETRLELYQKLGKDEYWLLDKWYYVPILNLVTLKTFKSDPNWIAKRLDLPQHLVAEALQTLVSNGFLHLKSNGDLARTRLKIRFPTGNSHQAIRAYHAQGMQRALKNLEPESAHAAAFRQRLITGISFAGNSENLVQAQILINEALYKVAELMSASECDEIYHIGLQFLKITSPA